jgi:cell division protein FtsQ
VTGQGPPTTRPPRLKPDEVAAAQRRDAPPKARPAKGAPPKAASTEPPPPSMGPVAKPPPPAKAPVAKPPPPAKAGAASTKPPPPAKAGATKAPSSRKPPPPKAEAAKAASSRKAPPPKAAAAPKVPASRRSADGRVVVDSRLRARRVEVRIDEGRRRLRRIAWAAGAAATLVLLAGLTQSPLLAVRHVRVAATAHTTAAELQAASGIHTGRPMLDVDAAAAAARLRRLPWVRTVAVKRQWPTTVRITVTERHPVAQISHGKGWLLVDVHGRALAQVATPPAGLVRLVGVAPASPGRQVAHSTAAIRLTRALPASVKPDVAWIAVDRSGQLALRIRSGGKVVVGSLAELDAKMIAVATMLGHLQPHSFCTVDVQVPNAPTLTRASACA